MVAFDNGENYSSRLENGSGRRCFKTGKLESLLKKSIGENDDINDHRTTRLNKDNGCHQGSESRRCTLMVAPIDRYPRPPPRSSATIPMDMLEALFTEALLGYATAMAATTANVTVGGFRLIVRFLGIVKDIMDTKF